MKLSIKRNLLSFTSRKKISCFSVSKSYMVFGTLKGSLLVFNKFTRTKIFTIPSSDLSRKKVGKSPSIKMVDISGSEKHCCVVNSLNEVIVLLFKRNGESVDTTSAQTLKSYQEEQGTHHVTSVVFSTVGKSKNKSKPKEILFIGYNNGKVIELDFSSFLENVSRVSYEELESPITQLQTNPQNNKLLISSVNWTKIVDIGGRSVKKVGKEMREAPMGACFLKGFGYSARPNRKMWKFNKDTGKVVKTFQLPQKFKKKFNVNFKLLYPFLKYVVSHDDNIWIMINVEKERVLDCRNIRRLRGIKVVNNECYMFHDIEVKGEQFTSLSRVLASVIEKKKKKIEKKVVTEQQNETPKKVIVKEKIVSPVNKTDRNVAKGESLKVQTSVLQNFKIEKTSIRVEKDVEIKNKQVSVENASSNGDNIVKTEGEEDNKEKGKVNKESNGNVSNNGNDQNIVLEKIVFPTNSEGKKDASQKEDSTPKIKKESSNSFPPTPILSKRKFPSDLKKEEETKDVKVIPDISKKVLKEKVSTPPTCPVENPAEKKNEQVKKGEGKKPKAVEKRDDPGKKGEGKKGNVYFKGEWVDAVSVSKITITKQQRKKRKSRKKVKKRAVDLDDEKSDFLKIREEIKDLALTPMKATQRRKDKSSKKKVVKELTFEPDGKENILNPSVSFSIPGKKPKKKKDSLSSRRMRNSFNIKQTEYEILPSPESPKKEKKLKKIENLQQKEEKEFIVLFDNLKVMKLDDETKFDETVGEWGKQVLELLKKDEHMFKMNYAFTKPLQKTKFQRVVIYYFNRKYLKNNNQDVEKSDMDIVEKFFFEKGIIMEYVSRQNIDYLFSVFNRLKYINCMNEIIVFEDTNPPKKNPISENIRLLDEYLSSGHLEESLNKYLITLETVSGSFCYRIVKMILKFDIKLGILYCVQKYPHYVRPWNLRTALEELYLGEEKKIGMEWYLHYMILLYEQKESSILDKNFMKEFLKELLKKRNEETKKVSTVVTRERLDSVFKNVLRFLASGNDSPYTKELCSYFTEKLANKSDLLTFYQLQGDQKSILNLLFKCNDTVGVIEYLEKNSCRKHWKRFLGKINENKGEFITKEMFIILLMYFKDSNFVMEFLEQNMKDFKNLGPNVYQKICALSKVENQQKKLNHEIFETIGSYLWTKKTKSVTQQIVCIVEVLLKKSEYEKARYLKNLTTSLGLFEENEKSKQLEVKVKDFGKCKLNEYTTVHWGVQMNTDDEKCKICNLHLKEGVGTEIEIFHCGHSYHTSCNPSKTCVVCVNSIPTGESFF